MNGQTQSQQKIVTLNLPIDMVQLIINVMAHAQIAWAQANPVIVSIESQVRAAEMARQQAEQVDQLKAEEARQEQQRQQAKAQREAAKAAKAGGVKAPRGRKGNVTSIASAADAASGQPATLMNSTATAALQGEFLGG